jgi:hypothetical protein
MRAAFVIVALAGTAHAEAPADVEAPGWSVGLALRSDYGAHRVRIPVGVHNAHFAATLVVDPKVFVDTKQNDVDLLAEWFPVRGGWAALGGYRLTQISIDRGVQFQHEILLGATASLPELSRRTQVRFGMEVEITMLRHGDGLDVEWFSVESDRHFRDLLSLNLFLRISYTSAL